MQAVQSAAELLLDGIVASLLHSLHYFHVLSPQEGRINSFVCLPYCLSHVKVKGIVHSAAC